MFKNTIDFGFGTFHEADTGTNGATDTQTNTDTPPSGDPAGAATPTPQGTPEEQAQKTIPYDRFKQKVDEVNQYTNALKELGFETIDSLKEFATTAKTLQEKEQERQRSEMSEIERLQDDLKKANDTIQTLNSSIETSREQSRKEKVRSTFNQLATQQGVGYVEDAYQLVKEQVDSLELNEEGKVVGIEDIVKNLVETKPFLLTEKREEKQTPEQIGGASNPPEQTEQTKSKAEVLKEYAARAKASGRHEDMVAYMQKKKELGL